MNTAREFAVAAQEHSKVEVMYLDKADVINLPLDDVIPLPGTLQVHHVDVCNIDKKLVMKKNSCYKIKDEPVFRTLNYSNHFTTDKSIMSEDMQQATSSTLEDVPQAALTLIPGDYYKVLYIFESNKGPIPKELIAVLESVNEDKSGGNFTFLK